MKAAVITADGLKIQDVPRPDPKPNEVLVRVRAAGLNRADLAMTSGLAYGHAGGQGTIAGLEFAGEVAAVGDSVQGVQSGDRVMCFGGGGYAEFAVADYGRCVPIPANNMSFEQAATLPVALMTMHNAVVSVGQLRTGESVLIQGASSGVGLMGMQIAKLMGAKLVLGSSTSASRRARLHEFGADAAIDTTDPNWHDAVLAATGGVGVNLIVDQVSGGVANGNIKVAALLGRIVNVGRLGGQSGEFDFELHALKRINYIGVTFRTRTADEVREINRAMRADLWPAVERGALLVPIDRVFPLDQVVDAQDHMRANRHLGKIVLTV